VLVRIHTGSVAIVNVHIDERLRAHVANEGVDGLLSVGLCTKQAMGRDSVSNKRKSKHNIIPTFETMRPKSRRVPSVSDVCLHRVIQSRYNRPGASRLSNRR
jgi:hypothetical protein